MSIHEYVISKQLNADDPPFYALIMAAVMQADSENFRLLTQAWPEVVEERRERYNREGGCLTPAEMEWLKEWDKVHATS
jgi:hypothetical protein